MKTVVILLVAAITITGTCYVVKRANAANCTLKAEVCDFFINSTSCCLTVTSVPNSRHVGEGEVADVKSLGAPCGQKWTTILGECYNPQFQPCGTASDFDCN